MMMAQMENPAGGRGVPNTDLLSSGINSEDSRQNSFASSSIVDASLRDQRSHGRRCVTVLPFKKPSPRKNIALILQTARSTQPSFSNVVTSTATKCRHRPVLPLSTCRDPEAAQEFSADLRPWKSRKPLP